MHPIVEEIIFEEHIPLNIMGYQRAKASHNDANRNNNNPQLPRTFTYPIALDANDDTMMKKISPAFLPTFRGLSLEDLDQFLFEFKVLCQTYDYKMITGN